MTEFWVSQGNKWCDFCKIYISKNATSIRTHELGTRHKDNVAKKLAGVKKDNTAKEMEKAVALKDLEKIEKQAKKSYERDLAAMRSLGAAAKVPEIGKEGLRVESLGAVPAAQTGSERDPATQKIVRSANSQVPASQMNREERKSSTYAAQNASSASRFRKSGKGMVASSLEVSKRKGVEKSGSSSSEEIAALALRESARKRIKEREESLLGLYRSF